MNYFVPLRSVWIHLRLCKQLDQPSLQIKFRQEDLQHLNGASHTVQYMEALKYAKKYLEMRRDLQLNPMEAAVLSQSIGLTLPISLHQAAFVPVLQTQTNEQQKRKWLQPALDLNIIGCYAQTELSHGSNIRCVDTVEAHHTLSKK